MVTLKWAQTLTKQLKRSGKRKRLEETTKETLKKLKTFCGEVDTALNKSDDEDDEDVDDEDDNDVTMGEDEEGVWVTMVDDEEDDEDALGTTEDEDGESNEEEVEPVFSSYQTRSKSRVKRTHMALVSSGEIQTMLLLVMS